MGWFLTTNGFYNGDNFIEIELRYFDKAWIITGWKVDGGSYTLGIFDDEKSAKKDFKNIMGQLKRNT